MVREYKVGGAKSTTALVLISYQLLNCFLSVLTLNHPLDGAFMLKLFVLALFPLLYLILAFQWPVNLAKGFSTITIDENGIKVGLRRMRWDELDSISHGLSFFKKYPLIYLKRESVDAKFLTLNVTSTNIPILGYSFVYDEIIPYIKKRRPDIFASDVVPRSGNAAGIRKLIGGASTMLAALFQIVILLLTLESMRNAAYPQVQLYALLIFLPSLAASFICRDFREESIALSFLRGAVAGTGVSISAAIFTFYFFTPPAWTISALAIFCLITLTMSFAALALSVKWRISPVALYAATVATAIISISLTYFPLSRLQDLSTVFGNDAPLCIWSVNGRYIADVSAINGATKRFLVDVVDATVIQIPSHANGDVIRWFDSNIVIRRTKTNDNTTQLLIYDLRLKKEFVIDEAPHIDVSQLNPVSKRGELIWLTYDAARKKTEVRKIDLSKQYGAGVTRVEIRLSDKYKWRYVDWYGDDEIIARGFSQGDNLVISRYNPRTKKSRMNVFKHKATVWCPISDFKHAFTTLRVTDSSGITTSSVSYVDLETGKVKALRGFYMPSWSVNDQFAFRTLRVNGKKFFLRFNLRTSREELICRIPAMLFLSGVSHDGRFAFFAYDGLVSFATFRIFDIEKKQWSEMETTGFSGFSSGSGMLALMNPRFSIWSPTSNSAVIETLECAPERRLIKSKTKIWSLSAETE